MKRTHPDSGFQLKKWLYIYQVYTLFCSQTARQYLLTCIYFTFIPNLPLLLFKTAAKT